MSSIPYTKSIQHRRLNVVVGVTGSIAAYKSVILVRRLVDAGHQVRVVMTRGGQEFVTPLTFQAVSGNQVSCELLDTEAEAGMGHIELARWADVLVIAPASANIIARLVSGMADDLLTTLVLATKAPIWFAPAMNQQMWASVITQQNMTTLVARGFRLLQPDSGIQACGDVGFGRMIEPEAIAHLLQMWSYASQLDPLLIQAMTNKHIVITAGPTREAIDPVRYLSNYSTGKMGFALAEACRDLGAKVTLITGPVMLKPPMGVDYIAVTSAQQMLEASKAMVDEGCDVYMSCAAVADYRAREVADHKIKKSEHTLQVEFEKNTDIVATIAAHPKKPFMVGFAAETQHMEDYAKAKLENKKLDIIASNDVSRSDIGFGSDENAMTVFFAPQYKLEKQVLAKAGKYEIACGLIACVAWAIGK